MPCDLLPFPLWEKFVWYSPFLVLATPPRNQLMTSTEAPLYKKAVLGKLGHKCGCEFGMRAGKRPSSVLHVTRAERQWGQKGLLCTLTSEKSGRHHQLHSVESGMVVELKRKENILNSVDFDRFIQQMSIRCLSLTLCVESNSSDKGMLSRQQLGRDPRAMSFHHRRVSHSSYRKAVTRSPWVHEPTFLNFMKFKHRLSISDEIWHWNGDVLNT